MGMIDEKLESEIATLREAIGLMTTAKPDMVMDVDDPIGMAHQVVKEADTLRSRIALAEKVVAVLRKWKNETGYLSEGWEASDHSREMGRELWDALAAYDRAGEGEES
jgi:predicted glycosyltransferase